MILKYVKKVLLIGVLCAFLTPRHACAQTYVRYGIMCKTLCYDL